jgi:hypothetical protein
MDRIYLRARNTLRAEVSEERAIHRAAGLSGIVVVVLFGVGNALWSIDIPQPGASAREILGFYAARSTRIVVDASLSLVAIGVFAYFGAALRALLARLEGDEVLGTTAFAGVILACAAGLGAETINMVGAMRAGDLSPELGRSVFEISRCSGSRPRAWAWGSWPSRCRPSPCAGGRWRPAGWRSSSRCSASRCSLRSRATPSRRASWPSA